MADTDQKPIHEIPRHPETDDWEKRLNLDQMPKGQWPEQGSVPLSVLVPVKNESANLPECLLRLSWAKQLVVVDSQSTDATIPIAQAFGADVYQFHYNPSVDWMKKKNWSITNIPWRHEWLLIMDADEYMTPELAEEIKQVVLGNYKPRNTKRAGCGDGYWINRRFMFMGKWIKHCGYYPSYNVRLFKHKVGLYERMGEIGDTGSGDNEVHEHVILSTGEAGYLEKDFLHYAYPDLSIWIEKHNRYSTWEAHVMRTKGHGNLRAMLWGGGPVERRRWLKIQASYLPFRPLLRFLYTFVLRLGFLDGYPGYVMSKLMAWYEFISLAKRNEMDLNELPIKFIDNKPVPRIADAIPQAHVPVSILIFANNAEDTIAQCIKSCSFSDDIHLIVDGSEDRTCEIAQEMGVRVHSRASQSFEELCNWAIQNVDYQHDWRFVLNADERLRPELTNEVRTRLMKDVNGQYSAYRVPYRLILQGQWIKHSSGYPVYQTRLFKNDTCRFQDNELVVQPDSKGKTGTLEEPYDYYAFTKGLTDWFEFYNDYSTFKTDLAEQAESEPEYKLGQLWVRDPMIDAHSDEHKHKTSRPFLLFLYLYFLRMGFIDGNAGLYYCSMISNYAYWVRLKIIEQNNDWFDDIDQLAQQYLQEESA